MEITKGDFTRALIEFFLNEIRTQRGGVHTFAGRTTGELRKYLNFLESDGIDKQLVHIGNTFGPFGFKVEEKQ